MSRHISGELPAIRSNREKRRRYASTMSPHRRSPASWSTKANATRAADADQCKQAVVIGARIVINAHAGELPHRAHHLTARASVSGSASRSVWPSNNRATRARPHFLGYRRSGVPARTARTPRQVLACVRNHVALGAAGIGSRSSSFRRWGAICASTAAVCRAAPPAAPDQRPLLQALDRRDFVDDAEPLRGQQIGAAAADADDARGGFASLRARRERAADQTDAEYDQLASTRRPPRAARFPTVRRFMRAKDCRSAYEKRSFFRFEADADAQIVGMPSSAIDARSRRRREQRLEYRTRVPDLDADELPNDGMRSAELREALRHAPHADWLSSKPRARTRVAQSAAAAASEILLTLKRLAHAVHQVGRPPHARTR